MEGDEEEVLHLVLCSKVTDDIVEPLVREMQVNEDSVSHAFLLVSSWTETALDHLLEPFNICSHVHLGLEAKRHEMINLGLPTLETRKIDLVLEILSPDISVFEVVKHVSDGQDVLLRESQVDEAVMLVFDGKHNFKDVSEIATPSGLKQADMSFFANQVGFFNARTVRVTERAEPQDSDIQTNVIPRGDLQGGLKLLKQHHFLVSRQMQVFKSSVHGA